MHRRSVQITILERVPSMPYRLITLLAVGVAVVAAAGPSSAARTTVCRHADVVFYSTDSVRLAQRLHANPSACADYYISVTPAADGISPRANVAPTIRANGSHAMPELRLPGWAAWVATNGKTWFDAGVEARVRMQTAGFDVSKGDTWALNEVGSPSNTKLGVDVFTNAGTARADMREFVRGLYTGAAGMAPSPGLVFVADPLQMSSDLAQYKTQLQDWYADSAFWSDMSRYVRFWGQETYADARAWGVADSGLATRGDHLDDYFQYANLLAQAGPGSVNAARSFLQAAYTPIGNAAFPQPAPEANPGGIGFGYTAISPTSMQNFVSTQIYALRAFHAAGASTAGDQFGFAWVPNTSVTPPPTFVSLADRLEIGRAHV